jgi:DNA repair exonuclease SbcCD ATPase subunit
MKAEKRISEHRLQKEEALHVRVSKANDATEKEKEISSEISALEDQRDELEAELKKVNISLASAQARLHNTREERDQFEEANNQIVAHLKSKEDEFSKSISSCRVEADVLHTWVNFLEDTWVLQCTYTETKEKQANEELESHEDYFVNLAVDLLSAYKKELEPSVDRIGKFVKNLKKLSGGAKTSNVDDDDSKVLSPRTTLEEEYLSYEAKIVTTFSVVNNMKEQLYGQQGIMTRKDSARIKELFDDIEKFRQEFDSIERPNLELETPLQKADPPVKELPQESPSDTLQPETVTVKTETEDPPPKEPVVEREQALDPEAELTKLESEFGKVGEGYAAEEIDGWEFDELEKELTSGD